MEYYFVYENGYDSDKKCRLLLDAGFDEKNYMGIYHPYVRDNTIVNLTSPKNGTMQIQQHTDRPSKDELSELVEILKPDRIVDVGFNDIDPDELFKQIN